MAIIEQFSRISHHTVTTVGLTGTTFTVPSSNDFTDGSWSNYDLDLSEIGVDEDRNKAYIRISSNINEIQFKPTTLTYGEVTLGSSGTAGQYTVVSPLAKPDSKIQIVLYSAPLGDIYVTRNTDFFTISSTSSADTCNVGWYII